MDDIRKTWLLAAPVEAVYEQWISNDTVIPPALRMDITPEVGGAYILISGMGDTEATMVGHFKEVVPNQRLVYTWEWNQDGQVSLITVDFHPHRQGTRLELSHVGWQDQASRAIHDTGWDSYIQGFKALLAARG